HAPHPNRCVLARVDPHRAHEFNLLTALFSDALVLFVALLLSSVEYVRRQLVLGAYVSRQFFRLGTYLVAVLSFGIRSIALDADHPGAGLWSEGVLVAGRLRQCLSRAPGGAGQPTRKRNPQDLPSSHDGPPFPRAESSSSGRRSISERPARC